MTLVLNTAPCEIESHIGRGASMTLVRLACHEASHVLVALANGIKVTKVSTVPNAADSPGDGYVLYDLAPLPASATKAERDRWVWAAGTLAVAGDVGEGFLACNVGTPAFQRRQDWAPKDKDLLFDALVESDCATDDGGTEVGKGVLLFMRGTRSILRDRYNDLDSLTVDLVRRRVMTGAEVLASLRTTREQMCRYGAPMPTGADAPATPPARASTFPDRTYAGRFEGRFGTADRSRLLYRGPYR